MGFEDLGFGILDLGFCNQRFEILTGICPPLLIVIMILCLMQTGSPAEVKGNAADLPAAEPCDELQEEVDTNDSDDGGAKAAVLERIKAKGGKMVSVFVINLVSTVVGVWRSSVSAA